MAFGFSEKTCRKSAAARRGGSYARRGRWLAVGEAGSREGEMDERPPRARRLLLSGAGEQLRHVTALNGTAAAGHAHDILGIVTREEAAGYVTGGI